MNQKNNQTVVIMGLGRHGGGISSAIFFARLKKKVLVTDLETEKVLQKSLKKLKKFKNIKYVLGQHQLAHFKHADLIIRNPAVKNNSIFLQTARKHNIPIHTDISWFLQELKKRKKHQSKIIGITGTKGKSTTAALTSFVLKKCNKKTILAGNIRKSPLDFIKFKQNKIYFPKLDFIVLELSSWQLESLNEHQISPNIALITNILPDHLNSYKNFKEYKKVKTFIFKHQTKKDLLILNQENKHLKQIAQNKKIIPKIKLVKRKNLVTAITDYLKLNKKTVQKTIKQFPGLEGRLELVNQNNQIKYYNDTCATIPDATIYSIKKLKKEQSGNIILIAGGEDKKVNYNGLAKTIEKKVKSLILLPGSASKKIKKAISQTVDCYQTTSMYQAVKIAKKQAKPGDIVLLSPASASFNLFANEFDRGKKFKKQIKNLKNE